MPRSTAVQSSMDSSGRAGKIKRCLVLFLLTFLVACTSARLPVAGRTPTGGAIRTTATLPPATPTLQPAANYTEGLNEIPPGNFLFVEYWETLNGKSLGGQCPGASMIDSPIYSFYSGVLENAPVSEMGRGTRNSLTPVVGFFGSGHDYQGAMGGGTSSSLDVIDTLPYPPSPGSDVIIHSVDAQGAIVAQVAGATYFLKPGQSWRQHSGSFQGQLCYLETTVRLTNYGLLDRKHIGVFQDPRNDLGSPHRLVWSPAGKQLIFAGRTGITFYSASPLSPVDRWPTTFDVLNVALSPDGRTLAFSGSDGTLHVRSLSSDAAHELVLSDPPGPWKSLAFSPDGATLVAGSQDGIIQRWDSATGQAIGQLWMDHMDTVSSLLYSPDGKFILTDDDWMIRIWDPATGQVSRSIRTMDITETVSYDAIWSPDGKTIAWGSYPFKDGKVVELLDAATGGSQGALVGQNCDVWSVAYRPDGKLIGGGSKCGSVQVWDVGTGALKSQWMLDEKGKFDIVSSLAFSPDGRQLAAYYLTGSSQQAIQLIELETGQTTQVYPDQP